MEPKKLFSTTFGEIQVETVQGTSKIFPSQQWTTAKYIFFNPKLASDRAPLVLFQKHAEIALNHLEKSIRLVKDILQKSPTDSPATDSNQIFYKEVINTYKLKNEQTEFQTVFEVKLYEGVFYFWLRKYFSTLVDGRPTWMPCKSSYLFSIQDDLEGLKAFISANKQTKQTLLSSV